MVRTPLELARKGGGRVSSGSPFEHGTGYPVGYTPGFWLVRIAKVLARRHWLTGAAAGWLAAVR